ncbi:phytanoyl-CoA dioxygenase family protein [Sphingomonas profundi]|uniref:phytanoyl-CoA dioxygenase family protein n=1 Tax=Alterirhizorhabdus profundi TaxID=2681549 RepID=UPI0018D1BDA3|nr:phytanoyl-CoA dioxygenase family protein [Sphingomonas profundi]
MEPLTDCTSLIGDRAALDRAIKDRGYWFFRNVLDQDAIAATREMFLAELERRRVIDPGRKDATWNGADLTDFPVKIEPLHEARTWRGFVGHPAIHAFFTRLLGVAPFWIPSVEYRITPPAGAQVPNDLLSGRHQDGFANGGMDLFTCWVPLNDIGADVGGLTVAEGLHQQGFFHDLNDSPQFRVPDGAIPDDVWKRSDYAPGDLVMFEPMIPHSGMFNRSNRFRLSLDIRVMPLDGHLPLVGTVLEIGNDHVVIANHDGRDVRLILDDDTYCRGLSGARIARSEMVARTRIGDPMLVPYEGDRAILFRPQR